MLACVGWIKAPSFGAESTFRVFLNGGFASLNPPYPTMCFLSSTRNEILIDTQKNMDMVWHSINDIKFLIMSFNNSSDVFV